MIWVPKMISTKRKMRYDVFSIQSTVVGGEIGDGDEVRKRFRSCHALTEISNRSSSANPLEPPQHRPSREPPVSE